MGGFLKFSVLLALLPKMHWFSEVPVLLPHAVLSGYRSVNISLQHTESIRLHDCADLAFLGERWAQSRICASAAGSVISVLRSPSVPPLASLHLCRWHCWELLSNLPDASVFIISLSWESETIVVELFHMRRYKSSCWRHSQTCSTQAHSLPAH